MLPSPIFQTYELKTEVPDTSNYVTKTDINFEKNESLFKYYISLDYISDVPVALLAANIGLGFANQSTTQHLGFSWGTDLIFRMFKAEPWQNYEDILQIQFMDDVFNLVSDKTIQVQGSEVVIET